MTTRKTNGIFAAVMTTTKEKRRITPPRFLPLIKKGAALYEPVPEPPPEPKWWMDRDRLP
jgi:hypothetical protein